MIEWIEDYVKALVDHPDQVAVSEKEGVKTVIVNVTVASEDYFLFKGRNNRLVRSLDLAVSLTGVKRRMRYVLKVVA